MKNTVVWAVTPCSLVEISQCFGEPYACTFKVGEYRSYRKHRGSIFLQNSGKFLPVCTVLHPKTRCTQLLFYSLVAFLKKWA